MTLLIVNSEHSDISILGCAYVEKYTWTLKSIILVIVNLEEKYHISERSELEIQMQRYL